MRFIFTILFSTILINSAFAGDKSTDGTKGWNTVGADVWSTSEGVLSSAATEGKSYHVSANTYDNFKIELEFKPDAAVNSGVFINCKNNTEIGSKNCFEANISDNHKKPEFRTGSIVRHAPPGAKVDSIGKWNKMVMTSANGKITLEINGVKTAEVSSEAHPSGYIGLQRFKDGVIQFRNISITSL
ncbi:MAG: 3-keto-disaccharide hydrolase [Cellvibrionaceae bacterium]